MKTSVMGSIAATTILLVTVTVFSVMNFPFTWVFTITCLGQIALLFMVYKILTDDYTTTKTFDDFYEDFPINKNE
jgi:cell division protein FtsW (lipid II flippase)